MADGGRISTSRTLAHRAIDGEPVPGTFAVSGVAPGSYRLYAWTTPVDMDLTSPQSMCQLASGGMPVEVKAGEVTKVQMQKVSEEPK